MIHSRLAPDTTTKPVEDAQFNSHERRLLRHLACDGAFALVDPEEAGQLNLYRRSAGVTLGAGIVLAKAGEALCAAQQATWQQNQGVARLVAMKNGAALADMPAPQLRHTALRIERRVDAQGEVEPVLVNRAESPLAWLHSRKDGRGQPLLSAEAFTAGERLRADMERARMMPQIGVNWSTIAARGARGSVVMEASESAVAARQRTDRALEAVGPEFSGLLIDVCGFLKGMPQVEMERGWPPRSARIVLGLALGRLSQHYETVRRREMSGGPARQNETEHVQPFHGS
jgi:hypothetical protein